MRRELKARGVDRLKVVYSREEARKPETDNSLPPSDRPEAPAPGRRAVPGSVVFVPGAAGLILAGEVVRDLCGV